MTCAWACAFCLRFLLFNCVSCLPRRLSAYRLQPQAVPILDVQNWCAAFERALKRQNRHRPDRRGSVSGATSGRLQPSARLQPVPKRPVFYPKPLCPRGPARLKWARVGSRRLGLHRLHAFSGRCGACADSCCGACAPLHSLHRNITGSSKCLKSDAPMNAATPTTGGSTRITASLLQATTIRSTCISARCG
ncbi:hypothetical protein PAMC26577_32945 [Caballeronia sordidicola]|uniref:Secreted protein n=1 Tax=Caballeronia sordidicola TaxID=196367 RepID=A0A242MBB3_CABSO|nr:hypothetical protein PAMC26577_32945 [Caballeronia sordidicola]